MGQYLSKLITDFKRDERGAFAVFVIGIFTSMILIGGAAIDMVRYEAVRSSIQNNLDRAVLAAASLRQTQDPETVVRDYMSKVETLSSFNVTIDQANTIVSLTSRKVSATATANISTYFLRIAGMNTLDVTAKSSASEEIPHLEISLVLDISSSMLGKNMNALKAAANEFVDTVITEDDNRRTSISIVPYATNVTVPESMWSLYDIEAGVTDKTRCMIFAAADYNLAAIDPTVDQRQLPYYSSRGTFASGLDFSACNMFEYAEIMPLSTSAAALHAKIDTLNANDETGGDNTAGHIATKWGVALLDPAANVIGADLGGDVAMVPTAYDERGVMKVLVVMTDGSNTNHYELFDEYRKGLSDRYSVFEDSNNGKSQDYIYKHDTGRYYEVNGDSSLGDSFEILPGSPSSAVGLVGHQSQYTWPEVWEITSIDGYARMISQNQFDFERVYSSDTDVDTQMNNACTVAKDNGVLVYTISFKASSHQAKTLFQNCASSLGYYYDVDDLDIGTAFASIARSIQKLRLLTQ